MRVLPPSHYYTSLVIRSHFGPAERNKVEKERPFHLLYWIALLTGSCYIQVQPFSSSQIAKRTNWTGQLLHWTGRAANAKTFSSALKYTARRCTAWAPEKSIKIIIPSPDVCNTTCYVLWAIHKLHLHFWSLDLLAAIQGITSSSSSTFFLPFAQILEYFIILKIDKKWYDCIKSHQYFVCHLLKFKSISSFDCFRQV